MQAAVVSVLLMAGACGSSGEQIPAPAPVIVATSRPTHVSACDYSPTHPSPAGGNYYYQGVFGCPYYSPVWLLHDHAAYYPGNYAVPYDYREIFNYPWHGPLPAAPAGRTEFIPFESGISSERNEFRSTARAKPAKASLTKR